MTTDRRRPLDARVLRQHLRPPWRRLDILDETGSTNADLLDRAAAGEDIDGAVLIAEHQTAGRGRSNRTWWSPPAQITLSVGIGTGGIAAASWGWLPLACGVAVVDAVAAVTGITVGLKWPNDLLAGDRKLAGILAEVARPSAIVVGIGLNVTLSPEEADEPQATSLLELGVRDPDRTLLASRVLQDLGHRVGQWRRADPQLKADYRSHSLTIANTVRAILPGGQELVGSAESVDDQGRLRINTRERTVAVSAGDVIHVRPSH